MVAKKVRLANRYGLHMRPAQGLMQVAAKQKCEVFIESNGTKANAKSIIELISLAAEGGSEINVICQGDKEAEGLKEVVKLIEQMPELYEEDRI
jgi:phosphocarrier protein HPr